MVANEKAGTIRAATVAEEDDSMKAIRHFLQHQFNPLHVFCRLRNLGLSAMAARSFSRLYERGVYRFIL